jgi:N-acetylmuramoyl-L-alanine amidase
MIGTITLPRFIFFILLTWLFLNIGFCSADCAFKDCLSPKPVSSYSAHKKTKTPPLKEIDTVSPIIILDAGHGGVDEGAKVKQFKEKKITLITALLTKKYLEDRGYRVIMTRTRDVFVSLSKRVATANKTGASLFVSIHYNASPNPSAKGIEIYYYDAREQSRARASKRLASCILPRVIDETEAVSRGVRAGNFHVIRETQMPAVLVEGGFVTNQEERSLLNEKRYLDQIAKGIAEGVDKYLKSS